MYHNEPIGYSICPICGMRRSLVQGAKCRCQVSEELKELEEQVKNSKISIPTKAKLELQEAFREILNKKKTKNENN